MDVWHEGAIGGHPGRGETTHCINEHYYWLGAHTWIADYIKGCATCQQNKNLTMRRKTPLYCISVSENPTPFTHVTMDLITGLPKSEGYNAILTIVDHRCTCAALFLPCTIEVMGTRIAKLYFDNLYRWFGLPTCIISDRDLWFTSHFGKALTKNLGIQQNLSMAYPPQTDGLSERKNQWVEQYLQLVVTNQDQWSKWLPLATAVHNNSSNTTTGITPNQLLFRFKPRLSPEQSAPSNNHVAEHQTSLLRQYRSMAVEALNKMARTEEQRETQWKIGQQVWLEAKNLLLAYGTVKLTPRRHDPFKIIQVISPVAYQLAIPHQWNIHPVFHTSLLTPYIKMESHGPNYSRPPPDLISGENEYEVEAI